MKAILICIDTLSTAGAQRFVTELACNLISPYKPIIIVTNRLDVESSFYKKLCANHVAVIDVSDRSIFKETSKIINVIQDNNVKLIHSNVGAVFYVMLAHLLCGFNGHHIFTVHSMGFRIFDGKKKKLIKLFFKKGWIIPVAICDTVKASMMEAYNLNEGQVECIYNGVDTTIFKPDDSKKIDNIFTIVNVASMYWIKNHKLLVDAFAIIHKKYNNTRLILLGDGELRVEIENQVRNLGLQKSVFFYGNCSDVAKYLNASDVYCCTSEVEGLPLSVLEAMACGLPIVSTPAGGVVDIVKDGENGYIIPYDAEKIAIKIINLIENEELRQCMSIDSRNKAIFINENECISAYECLYEKYSK